MLNQGVDSVEDADTWKQLVNTTVSLMDADNDGVVSEKEFSSLFNRQSHAKSFWKAFRDDTGALDK